MKKALFAIAAVALTGAATFAHAEIDCRKAGLCPTGGQPPQVAALETAQALAAIDCRKSGLCPPTDTP